MKTNLMNNSFYFYSQLHWFFQDIITVTVKKLKMAIYVY